MRLSHEKNHDGVCFWGLIGLKTFKSIYKDNLNAI